MLVVKAQSLTGNGTELTLINSGYATESEESRKYKFYVAGGQGTSAHPAA